MDRRDYVRTTETTLGASIYTW